MLDISVGNGVRGEETIASIGAGSFVGERSLMTGEPRSATVRAAGDAILFVVPKAAMGELLRDHPDLAEQIAQVMAQRNEERQQSHHAVNMRARSYCSRLEELFGITHRARQRGVTSNEKSIEFNSLKSLTLGPRRHPGGEQGCGHCGKVHHCHRHPGAVGEQPGELLQRGRPEELREHHRAGC
jgi:Cyclic nucleotide-binding domain